MTDAAADAPRSADRAGEGHVHVHEASARPGLLVIGHGSRDPRASEEFGDLLELVRVAAGDQPVRGGFLELADPPIDEAVDALVADGATDIVAVPYVLFGAGHLKDDGPAVLDRARRRHPGVRFRLARDLGVHPAVLDVAEDRAREARPRAVAPPAASEVAGETTAVVPDGRAVVVIGRGSTDPDACAEAVKLVRLLSDGRGLGLVEPAFQAMSTPSLGQALERCRLLGATDITVLPLFLFAGVLVERIAEAAATWADGHGTVEVTMARHLGVDPRLASLVVERQREAREGDVRMNCDVCAYRVRLPGFEDKVGTPLSLAPPDKEARGWRSRRAANQAAAKASERRARPRLGLGRRLGAPPSPDRDAPAVEITGLRHTWPDGTVALAGVDLTVANRERVAVLGPNGSGKTTLVLHLVGALERAGGTVAIGGTPVTRPNLVDVRRRVGLVFQDPDDQLFLPTVRDDVAFGPGALGLVGDDLDARVASALDVVGLTDLADRAPHQLSLGERRRAALAGVLAMHPEVLVLDEPTANLDPASRRDLVEVVRGLEVTTIVVTHDLPLALELCPRSVVLSQGRVAADGPTAGLLANRDLMAAHRLELPYGMVVASPTVVPTGSPPT